MPSGFLTNTIAYIYNYNYIIYISFICERLDIGLKRTTPARANALLSRQCQPLWEEPSRAPLSCFSSQVTARPGEAREMRPFLRTRPTREHPLARRRPTQDHDAPTTLSLASPDQIYGSAYGPFPPQRHLASFLVAVAAQHRSSGVLN